MCRRGISTRWCDGVPGGVVMYHAGGVMVYQVVWWCTRWFDGTRWCDFTSWFDGTRHMWSDGAVHVVWWYQVVWLYHASGVMVPVQAVQSCPWVGCTRGSGRVTILPDFDGSGLVSTSEFLVSYWLFLGSWINVNLRILHLDRWFSTIFNLYNN